jgi:hypothetical protein
MKRAPGSSSVESAAAETQPSASEGRTSLSPGKGRTAVSARRGGKVEHGATSSSTDAARQNAPVFWPSIGDVGTTDAENESAVGRVVGAAWHANARRPAFSGARARHGLVTRAGSPARDGLRTAAVPAGGAKAGDTGGAASSDIGRLERASEGRERAPTVRAYRDS